MFKEKLATTTNYKDARDLITYLEQWNEAEKYVFLLDYVVNGESFFQITLGSDERITREIRTSWRTGVDNFWDTFSCSEIEEQLTKEIAYQALKGNFESSLCDIGSKMELSHRSLSTLLKKLERELQGMS